MPGFRLCEEDKKSLDAKYLCTYCDDALRDPVQTIACGHRYCRTCLDTITSDPKRSRCVEDGIQIRKNECFSDKFARKEVLSVVVYCVNCLDGCQWRGELRNLEIHEITCCFAKIPCVYPECGSLVTKAGLANHVQTQCAYREHECVHCGSLFAVSYMQEHQATYCPAYPIDCDHCGMIGIRRSQMPAHLSPASGNCSALETAYPIAESCSQESQVSLLSLCNVAVAYLEEYIRQQEVSSYNGVLLWKMNNFSRCKVDAMSGKQASIYSAAFYSSRHGYKMCARLHLNGDGMGKGTHISLFFVVMRGQYDALLRWPFRQKVTMMMLDQDNIEHVIDAFRPDPNSSSFQKPTREMNIASGCPLFCPLSYLDKHAYVRDDTMYIKIIVDTSDV